ncbi:hypothetical protein K493DRAFT_305424 [Basidiobolus meristosporus CBS 931.73]|uniref:Uncharacterized protein n=1 Tax=Basidiobolus meristosporus CBS 931.73 TaxID=1314790 RepID=A0A1Y1XWW2_9FUNG|nr:hypothetical protein K493DRAFT_305424 [Basidiobolus meristosporus CBS 931.73]|eukprot:ORX89834.1 hypothetical protein K493DRAFT_305424 [Basidiobolus meristosporus CBS 931.73]
MKLLLAISVLLASNIVQSAVIESTQSKAPGRMVSTARSAMRPLRNKFSIKNFDQWLSRTKEAASNRRFRIPSAHGPNYGHDRGSPVLAGWIGRKPNYTGMGPGDHGAGKSSGNGNGGKGSDGEPTNGKDGKGGNNSSNDGGDAKDADGDSGSNGSKDDGNPKDSKDDSPKDTDNPNTGGGNPNNGGDGTTPTTTPSPTASPSPSPSTQPQQNCNRLINLNLNLLGIPVRACLL